MKDREQQRLEAWDRYTKENQDIDYREKYALELTDKAQYIAYEKHDLKSWTGEMLKGKTIAEQAAIMGARLDWLNKRVL